MKRRALFIITSDPRRTGRVAEAVRIAAGVGAWPQVEVTIYLRGDAKLLLGEDAEDFVDGDNFIRYLPMLTGPGGFILAERETGADAGGTGVRLPVEFIDDAQLASRVASSHCVLRF